ncbi:MAG: CubicO group peptidase (beta-lactamase class C family), partial [Bradymonadia bacterium]
PMQPELLADEGAILQLLCDSKPQSRPGKRLAYHAITGGFILGEIIKRVTGAPIRELLTRVVRDPLGFTSFQYGVAPSDVARVAEDAWTGPDPPRALAGLVQKGFGVTMPEAVDLANHPSFLTGVVPSGNVVATADEACRFMEMLRNEGELDGVRVFAARTVRRAVGETSYLEFDDILKLPIRYGLGFMLGDRFLSFYGPNTQQAFGHLGFTRTLIWADPPRELSVALMSNGKPFIAPDLALWFNLTRTISGRVPRLR